MCMCVCMCLYVCVYVCGGGVTRASCGRRPGVSRECGTKGTGICPSDLSHHHMSHVTTSHVTCYMGGRHQGHGHMPLRPSNLRHRLGQLQDLGNSQTRQPFAPAASAAPSSI